MEREGARHVRRYRTVSQKRNGGAVRNRMWPIKNGCAMGQCQGRLVKSRSRVQLITRPQKMANTLQRQGWSARLVERRSHCTEKLLAG